LNPDPSVVQPIASRYTDYAAACILFDILSKANVLTFYICHKDTVSVLISDESSKKGMLFLMQVSFVAHISAVIKYCSTL
jgi:hypothetical protein